MKNIVTEQENIAKAVVKLVNSYKHKPCICEYQNLGTKPYNLSLSSLSGAPKLKEDVTGDYTGEFPFAIFLRAIPEDNSDRFDCEQLLTELAKYLEDNYEEIKLTDGREIEEIKQSTTAALVNRAQDGTVDYQVILLLRYNAKQ